MTTIACDVVVVGSTLGALVTGAYAARAGLRVALVEEDAQSKRPPILREPFLISRGAPPAPLELLLRELGTSPIDRRRLEVHHPAVQVVLPDARIDMGGGIDQLAEEFEAYGLAKRAEARGWLMALEARGEAARAAFGPAPPLRRNPGLRERLRRGSPPAGPPEGATAAAPPAPGRILDVVAPVAEALSRVAGADPRRVEALLLRPTLDGSIRGPDAGWGLLDLLRQRLVAFHGEVRSTPALALVAERRELGVDLGRERLTASALVLAAPGRLLAEAAWDGPDLPAWLQDPPDVFPLPEKLLRAERGALSSGMAAHLVDASDPASVRWLLRSPDPLDERLEWLVVRGHDLAEDAVGSLAKLTPFAGDRLVQADPGPAARWDLGGDEVRLRGAGWSVVRSRRPLVLSVGPDVAPELGTEGELMVARMAGLWLGQKMGARRRTSRVGPGR